MMKITPRDASLAVAQLMPHIIRGIQLDFFVKRGVTQSQFLVLAAIRADGECPMGTLARNLHIRMPTATGIVDRLVHARLLGRHADPGDRRQVMVRLTDKGARFIRDFESLVRARWEEVLKPLDPHELTAFFNVMTKLRQQLQHEAPPAESGVLLRAPLRRNPERAHGHPFDFRSGWPSRAESRDGQRPWRESKGQADR